ncbi:hypothetical protein AVEN_6134-1 [Araneus ventricosus]|uniref:Uncharacterized protein n=1 Tax=Araneus ventricosus TaxID=182803 RepID=A0A4Y2NBW9_ARAVE|nr:hypothetical protein AVEN_6134-1 [Araneus ventricosus]
MEDFKLIFYLLQISGIDVGDFSKGEENLDFRASRRNRKQKKKCHRDRGGLVARSRFWGRRVPSSKPDSSEDPPCMETVAR